MRKLPLLLGVSILVSIVFFNSAGNAKSTSRFLSFSSEATRITERLPCKRVGISKPMFGMGRIYSCILGKEETAKVFINETKPYSDKVKNIKIMWNDWKRDIGYGLHADKKSIKNVIKKLSAFYAPNKSKRLLNIFNKISPVSILTKQFSIQYEFTPGPSINEHLFIISNDKSRKKAVLPVFVSTNGALYGYVIEDKKGRIICKDPIVHNTFRGPTSYLGCPDPKGDNRGALPVHISKDGLLKNYVVQNAKGKTVCKNPLFWKSTNPFHKKIKGYIVCR